jgi:hypothetical protein
LRIHFSTYFQPGESYDYFEPRVDGRFNTNPAIVNFNTRIRTDQRKKLSMGISARYKITTEQGRYDYDIELNPSFRFSDKLTMEYEIELEKERNDVGFVEELDDQEIIFGTRDITDVTNFIRANYSFNTRMNLSFRLRHNWTNVKYHSFHFLNEDGSLGDTDYREEEDINYNAFTIDAVYRWRFAPGSDLYLVWKNSLIGETEETDLNFWSNFDRMLDHPQRNSFSIKVVYYLDFLNFQKKKPAG